MLIYANPNISLLPLGPVEGLRINYVNTSEISIQSGKALIRQTLTTRQLATLSSSFNKKLNLTWQQGNGLGGRATGVGLFANTIYYVYLLINSSGTFDAYFDISAVADNRPAFWNARMIGAVLTDGNS